MRVAGNEMDDAIVQYLKRKYNLLIGERTSEQVKIEIGSAWPLKEELVMEIKGRDLVEGVPKTVRIRDEEIREALDECVSTIVTAVRWALERTLIASAEASGDVPRMSLAEAQAKGLLEYVDPRPSYLAHMATLVDVQAIREAGLNVVA